MDDTLALVLTLWLFCACLFAGMAYWRLVLIVRKFSVICVGLMFSYNPLFQAWYATSFWLTMLSFERSIFISFPPVFLGAHVQRLHRRVVHLVRDSYEVPAVSRLIICGPEPPSHGVLCACCQPRR
jgi:hypothetical protein